MSKYQDLRKIDVSEHTELKGRFTYLSWSWAVDTLLQHDESATWTYAEPMTLPDGSMMVFCTVKAFGKEMTSQLAVMDNKNKAIKKPDSQDLNTAMMRCLAKAIALHGLGLYIYQGEDLPEVDALEYIEKLYQVDGIDACRKYFNKLKNTDRELCQPFVERMIALQKEEEA